MKKGVRSMYKNLVGVVKTNDCQIKGNKTSELETNGIRDKGKKRSEKTKEIRCVSK